MISSSTAFGGRTRDSGSDASGSSTRLRVVRKSAAAGST